MSKYGQKKLVGRRVLCCWCVHNFVQGVSVVHRMVLFHFCADCWRGHKGECEEWMRGVAG